MKKSNSSSKKAGAFIDANSRDLRSVFEKVKLLNEFSSKIIAKLDPAVAKYCLVANIVAHKLTLIAANGSVATQIRFQISDLLRKFAQDPELSRIKYIECVVRPTTSMPDAKKNPNKAQMQPLNPETAAIVHDIADALEDQNLKEIMQRIASHIKT